MNMQDVIINDTYDRISKILKNDQKYPYKKMGDLIATYVHALDNVESLYSRYPPLLDVVELGAALGYEGSAYQEEIIKQVKYKLSELRRLLPDIK
ncbi:MAG: hypothetical protein JWM07_651 [Candidatus Saccharibacteria bacterium]|nr:hypothetical protein [Candidatus Saccharibacteria bacterium]